MSRNWLRDLSRTFGVRRNRKARRLADARPARRLQIENLEARDVPSTTVTFQQGTSGYAGATEIRIDSNSPLATTNGATIANGQYFLDGQTPGTTAATVGSPIQMDLIRFDNLFVSGGGPIPDGSLIRSATLTYSTASTADAGAPAGPQSAGPYVATQLLAPFTTTTSWGTFAGGPQFGTQLDAPTTAFRTGATAFTITASANATSSTTASADVSQIVQNWAVNPASNLGIGVRAYNTADEWAVRTIGNATTSFRPSLTVTYDPPAAPVQVATFQQGVNGYTGNTSAQVLQSRPGSNPPFTQTTNDGSTLTAPAFIDGPDGPPVSTSGNDQMLIKFDNLFGSGPGQIPLGSTIQSAAFILNTASQTTANSQSNGAYGAFQMNIPFTTSELYTDPAWGGDGPTIGSSELGPELSRAASMYSDSRVRFDVTAAVQNWSTGATNNGLDIQAVGTTDGWDIHFPGSTNVSDRPKLVVYFTPPASTEPATNTLDLVNGELRYTGGAGLANTPTVSLSAGTYTLNDASGPITVTAAAQAAGWSATGTTATGPSASFTRLAVATGTGVDAITVAGADHAVTLDAGSTAGDVVNVTGAVTTGGGDFAVVHADSVTAAAGSLIDTGAGTVSLTANTIGATGSPIQTRAGRLILTAGAGGAFVNEADGANVVGTATGTGGITVTNTTGTLTVPILEVVRTESGPITLSSGDDVAINGFVGVSNTAGAATTGAVTINANTDGNGAQGYTQSAATLLSTGGDMTINVNTAAGGTGNAVIGAGSITGTITVNANGGSVLWNPGYTIPTDTTSSNFSLLSARNYVFQATGAVGVGNSVGTAASPIQTNSAPTVDNTLGSSTAAIDAGTGGIYLTDWGPLDLTVTRAVAAGGNVQLVAANFSTAGTTGSNLLVNGPVTTEGNITIRSDDDLTLGPAAVIGGVDFVGTVTLVANVDGNDEQRVNMNAAAQIVTQNATANAVTISVTSLDATVTNATIGGVTLANVKVGDGGTITIDAAPASFTAANKGGNITQAAGTLLDAGPNGRVVLRALSRLNAAAPATGAGIGTAAAPVLTKAGTVTITATNSPTFVTEADGASFAAALTGPGDVALASTAGLLVVSGPVNTDAGTVTLTSSGTGGGVRVNAALGDANTGNITVDAGTNDVVFNTAMTVRAGQTLTLNDGNFAELGVTTTNNGTITAANGIQVGNGETLTGTGSVGGRVSVLTGGTFTPAGTANVIANVGGLQVGANGILTMNVGGTIAGTDYDQVAVSATATPVDVTGGQLRLVVGNGVAVGNTFTLIDNASTNPAVVGQFAGGTTIRGFNNPLVTFSINYAGGPDGNDVVATVASVSTATGLLDVNGSSVIFFSNVGINNNVTLTQSGGVYTLTDAAAGPGITLTPAAVTAGWTLSNANHTASGPTTNGATPIALFSMGLSDGADTLNGVNTGAASFAINGAGTLTVAGPVTTGAAFSLDEFTGLTLNSNVTAATGMSITGASPITFSGASGLSTTAGTIALNRTGDTTVGGIGLTSPTAVNLSAGGGTLTLNTFGVNTPALNLTGTGNLAVNGTVTGGGTIAASGYAAITAAAGSQLFAPTVSLAGNAIGVAGTPVLTKAATVSAVGGSGGVYVTEADGASFSATATGSADVQLTNLAGTLTVGGTVATATGNILLSSADDVAVTGSVGGAGTSGTITINANTDGAGSQGYTQSVTGNLQTTNTNDNAAAITVGGTGSAVLGTGSIGANAGGTVNVTANGGSVLWNSAFGTVSGGTLPNPDGGSNSSTLHARNFVFSAGPTGSVGTLDTPLQTDNFQSAATVGNSLATITAGTGGIYLSDWGANDLTIASAVAAGGNIQLFSANAAGSNLYATGPVYTGAGNIFMAADDDLRLVGATVGGTGAQGAFAGTVNLQANRDGGNEQRITMENGATVVTTNATANAVSMTTFATDTTVTDPTIGGVLLGTVVVGNGGTITVDTTGSGTNRGQINQIITTRIDAGPNGHVVLKAANNLSGANPAVGAGIRFDLDNTGINTQPLQVFAKDVTITGLNTPVDVGEGNYVPVQATFTDSDGLDLAAVLSGPGSLKFNSMPAGIVHVVGPTNTDGGDITVYASGTNGGVIVNAPLGDANTGNITLDAGPNNVVFNDALLVPAGKTVTLIDGNHAELGPTTVVNAGGTLAAANGVELGSGDNLSGTGTVTAPLFALTGSTVTPGLSGPGTLATNNFSLTGGTLVVDLNGTTAGTGYDQVTAANAVDVTGGHLRLLVNTASLAVGNSFVVIRNDGTGAVTGALAEGTTATAFNDPRYQFTISTNGGDGNDVVATLSAVLPTVLDVVNNQVQYSAGPGINNSLTVGLAGGAYTFTDTGTTIGLTSRAVAAGWTGNNTNTVTGPSAGLTGIGILLSDGTDTVNGLTTGVSTTVSAGGSLALPNGTAVTGDLTVSGAATLTAGGTVAATNSVTVTGVGDVVQAAGSTFAAPTVNLSATNGVGTAAANVQTQAATVTASSGAGGVFVTEADGASFTAAATGSGDVRITNLAGTLTVGGATSTATGNIVLSSADGVAVNAAVGGAGTSGTISINANTDGVGSQGYVQSATGNLQTVNTTAGALAITVNTPAGGTGDAVLGTGSIGASGGSGGGTATVTANGGNVLWGLPLDLALANNPEGGANTQTLHARDYVFTTSAPAGSIGTAAAPIQTDAIVIADGLAGGSNTTLAAGSGGIYVSEWGTADSTIASATATGAGNVQIFAANAGGNNMFVTGPVKTDTGNIFLAADDNLNLTATALVGGPGFSGTVNLQANRDNGGEEQVNMAVGSAVVTSNNTANAVFIAAHATDGTTSDATIGGVTLANVTVGDGGTITVDGALNANGGGRIIQQAGTHLDAGATGTVVLRTKDGLNGANPAVNAGIGTAAQPIAVTAATVNVTAVNSPVFVTEADGAAFTAALTGPGTLNLATAAGLLTIAGPTNDDGGAVNLTGAGGVVVNAALGDTNTGPINVNSPLTGASPITLGTGALTVTQDADTTFAGTVSGAGGVVKEGTGALTLSAASGYTGATAVNHGKLVVTGSLTGTSGVAVGVAGTLAGTGPVGAVTAAGTVAPGVAGPGALNVDTVTFNAGSTLSADVNGSTAGTFDQVKTTGAVTLNGGTVAVTAGAAIPLGTQIVLIDNGSTSPVAGTFASSVVTANDGQTFTVSYTGGDGNDVVLTRANAAAPAVSGVQINDGNVQRSEVRSITVTFSEAVNFAGGNGNAASAFTLNRVGGGNVGLVATVAPDNKSVTLTWTGTAEIDPVSTQNPQNLTPPPLPSLADGVYHLTIADGAVTSAATAQVLDGDGNGSAGGAYNSPTDTAAGGPGQLRLLRLFGDATGNGTVDLLDLSQLRAAFNSTGPAAPYLSYLDADNSNQVDLIDLGQFRLRFNVNLLP